MNSNSVIILLATLIIIAVPGAAGADEIKIGALHDLSGATADVGRDYALGIAEAIRYVNDQGGVNGKQIKSSTRKLCPPGSPSIRFPI